MSEPETFVVSEVTFGGNTLGDKQLYLTGVARGEKNERERIIKLLEEYDAYINRDLLIALIKEENK